MTCSTDYAREYKLKYYPQRSLYKCQCKGVSFATPNEKTITCFLYVWECPMSWIDWPVEGTLTVSTSKNQVSPETCLKNCGKGHPRSSIPLTVSPSVSASTSASLSASATTTACDSFALSKHAYDRSQVNWNSNYLEAVNWNLFNA